MEYDFGLVLAYVAFGFVLALFVSRRRDRSAKRPQAPSASAPEHRRTMLQFNLAEGIINELEEACNPILRDPRTSARIEECTKALSAARSRLAEEFGRQALRGSYIEGDHEYAFRKKWETVVAVVEAKYGHLIVNKALGSLGFGWET